MSTFKTLRAIPEDEYDRLLAKQIREFDPDINAKVQLEKEIRSILANTRYNDDEKLRLIQAVTYLGTKEEKLSHMSTGITPAPTPRPAPVPPANAVQEEEPVAMDPDERGTQYLNSTIRGRAKNLLEFIDQHPTISVSPKNRLLLNGKEILESNFTDIMNYMFNPRNTIKKAPVGTDAFIHALKQEGAPSYIVGAKVAKKYLSKSTSSSSSLIQGGHGRKRPIGFAKFPHNMKSKFSHNLKSKISKKLKSKNLNIYKLFLK